MDDIEYEKSLVAQDNERFCRTFPESRAIQNGDWKMFCLNSCIVKNIEIDGIDLGYSEKIGKSDLSWDDDEYNDTIEMQGCWPYCITNVDKGNKFEIHYLYRKNDLFEFLWPSLDNVKESTCTYLSIKTLKFSDVKTSKFHIRIEGNESKDFMEESFNENYANFRSKYHLYEADEKTELVGELPGELVGIELPERNYKESELKSLFWEIEHTGSAISTIETTEIFRRMVFELGHDPCRLFKFSYTE